MAGELVNDQVVRSRLRGLVRQLGPRCASQEDLMQEALIHLWHLEETNPGQHQCWYLQGCRYHLQNHLRLGRSVDSDKHRSARLAREDVDPLSDAQCADNTWDDFTAKDQLSALLRELTPQQKRVLLGLIEGLTAREVAKLLSISHTLVNRCRQKIASAAVRLGIARSDSGFHFPVSIT